MAQVARVELNPREEIFLDAMEEAGVDLGRAPGVRDWIRKLIRDLNEKFNTFGDAINSNDASALLIENGASLPTAELFYRGRFAVTEGTGGAGDDELFICIFDGVGYVWQAINLP